MSRKARIRDEEKAAWDKVRMYVVSCGYGPLKPTATAFHGATVVLWDGTNDEDVADQRLGGLLAHAKATRKICRDDENVLVVVDLSAVRRSRNCRVADAAAVTAIKGSEPADDIGGGDTSPRHVLPPANWAQLLEAEGATREELGKVVGRPVAKALARLLMKSVDGSVTLVAQGLLAAVALKILRTSDVRAAGCRVGRLILVEPILSKALVNALLTGGQSKTAVRVDVAFADEATRERRTAMLRAIFAAGFDTVTPDDGGDTTLNTFISGRSMSGDSVVDTIEEARLDEPDAIGRSLWFAELTIDMDKQSKQPEQRMVDLSVETIHNSAAVAASAIADKLQNSLPPSVEEFGDSGEARFGALLLRGNRCVLARDLTQPPAQKRWQGMAVRTVTAKDREIYEATKYPYRPLLLTKARRRESNFYNRI